MQNELTLRQIVDGISALLAVMTPDGQVELVNRQILDYFGKTLEELKEWTSTDAVHPDDLPGVIAAWRRSLESGQPFDSEHRQRGADSVYRWFHVQGLPVRDAEGRIVRWCVLQTNIEDRKRAEGLLAGENLILEMTAKGSSLESILETLCRVVEQTASGSRCSVLLIDPSGSNIEQAVAPSLPSSYNARFSGTPVDHEGGPCTEAARRKTPVIVSDVAADTQWDTYGWRTAALTHGLKACWSTTILASNGLVLGTFAIYWREPRSPTAHDQKIIEQMTHLAAVAIERRRNEAALQESEERFRLIVDSIPGHVATLSAAGEVELVNRQLLEYVGMTPDTLKGWATSDIVHPDDLPRVIAALTSAIETGHPFDSVYRVRRADGVYRWFHVRALPLRDKGDRIIRWYVLHIDIDDRKRAEEALRESERELRQLIDSVPGMIAVADSTGQLEYANKRFLDYIGTTVEELSDFGYLQPIHPDEREMMQNEWLRCQALGQPLERDHRLRRFDGVYRWVHVRVDPLLDERGGIVRWYGLHTDIDDQRSAEEAHRQSEHHLRLLVETIPALVSRTTAEGAPDYVNRRVVDYTGQGVGTVRLARHPSGRSKHSRAEMASCPGNQRTVGRHVSNPARRRRVSLVLREIRAVARSRRSCGVLVFCDL